MTSNISTFYAPDRVVLAEFRTESNLSVLLRRRPAALLKVLDKPVIQHWIERFVGLGVRDVTIVTGHFPEQVRAFVGDGERWGLESVQYISTQPLSDWDEVLGYVGKTPGTAYASMNAFPQRSPASLSHSNGYWTGTKTREGYERVYELNSIRDFWAVNLESLETVADPFEPDNMYRISPHALVNRDIRRRGRGVVEHEASIEEQVTLEDVVVGERVRIGRGCSVVRSVMIDGSTAGSHLALENMVVDGGIVYSVDHDTLLELEDEEILMGEVQQLPDAPGGIERSLALILALATLPCLLWQGRKARTSPLAMLWRVIAGDSRLYGIRRLNEPLPAWAEEQVNHPGGVISLAELTASAGASVEEIAAINAYQINQFTPIDYLKLTGLWFGNLFRRNT